MIICYWRTQSDPFHWSMSPATHSKWWGNAWLSHVLWLHVSWAIDMYLRVGINNRDQKARLAHRQLPKANFIRSRRYLHSMRLATSMCVVLSFHASKASLKDDARTCIITFCCNCLANTRWDTRSYAKPSIHEIKASYITSRGVSRWRLAKCFE